MIHHLLEVWVPEIAGVIELIGIIIIVYGYVKCLFKYINSITKKTRYNLTICLGHSFATGLLFMMGAEILKSILVPSVNDIIILLGIVAIRIALALLLHYEVKAEVEREGHEQHA